MKTTLSTALVLLVATFAHAGQGRSPEADLDSREANLRASVALLRTDLRTQKVALITEMLQLTEEEDARFWPVYREYEVELAKINDERIGMIKNYAVAYDKMTDEAADRLAVKALELEARRNALTAKYYERMKSVLPTVTAVRFLQVEHQILLLLDLQIAASLPVIK